MTYAEEDHVLTFTVPISEPLPPQYFVRVVSDRWLQSESVLPVSFAKLLLPAKFPPPTELLDLQPLPISALRNPDFEALYEGRVRTFNPVQTQVFAALYNTDDAVFIGAPTGSGKTVCAEFAILRMISRALNGKCQARCVYVAPGEASAKERMKDWGKRFGEGLGLSVQELTGSVAADAKILEAANICVATPVQWDMLTRRWRQRKVVQEVALVVADELHLIGGEGGHIMEACMSRTRFISSQLKTPIRIVGLASSVANARDLGEWLGTPASCLFNFPPGVRPVPLEIHLQGFDVSNFEARMQAMAKPAYNAICTHTAGSKPALVFVPTRKHARLTALDLLTFAASNGQPQQFLHVPEDALAPYLDKIRDKALRHAIQVNRSAWPRRSLASRQTSFMFESMFKVFSPINTPLPLPPACVVLSPSYPLSPSRHHDPLPRLADVLAVHASNCVSPRSTGSPTCTTARRRSRGRSSRPFSSLAPSRSWWRRSAPAGG